MAASPAYGKRLLPHVVDDTASLEPDRVFSGAPVDDNDIAKGFKTYTFANLANAINRVAAYLESELGGKSSSFDTIAYIGPNDIRYPVVVLAAVKAGYQALLVSPRNSTQAQINLFEKTSCKALIHTDTHAKDAKSWQKERQMTLLTIPGVDDLMLGEKVPHYPYTRDFEEGRFDPLVTLHTSGSTGFPKPIVVKAGMMALLDAYHDLPDVDGRMNWVKYMGTNCSSLFFPMPLFHAAGLYVVLAMGIYYQTRQLLSPPTKPLSEGLVEQCLKASKADASFLPPALLENMSEDENATKLLASLNFVVTGSANIATSAGNKLAKAGVDILNTLASTEMTPYSLYKQDPEHWAYFVFDDKTCGFDWRQVKDDVYELWVVRKEKDPGFQACFYTFPDLNEWSTRDLYKKHPTRPNNWIYAGRADNIIVFSNGEKLNPVSIEDAITGHPKVRGALVVGSERFQAGLLIEPFKYPQSDDEKKAFLDELWPTVEKVNEETVTHGRVQRPYIALTTEGKDFPRAGKGSIQRAAAVALYKDEIEQLYKAAEQSESSNAPTLDMSSAEALATSLQHAIGDRLHVENIDPETDFFSAGMDSMQAMSVSRLLTASLKQAIGESANKSLGPRDLYQNPNAHRLAAHILTLANKGDAAAANANAVDEVQAMVDKYTASLPPADSLSAAPTPATSNLTVLLTGSTGSIGTYVLDMLNNHPKVSKVIALNRGADTQARQAKSSASRGLASTYPKTTFLTADLSKPQLGLSEQDYKLLLSETDAVLHNQWQVDFNLNIASFEPHIAGTRHLIDLATAGAKRPRIVFVTTIAEVAGWQPESPSSSPPSVPESPLPNHTVPGQQGYGAGKLAASRILEHAAATSGIHMAVVRVGQVAGPVDRPEGSWNRWEWFPSIVASSAELRALPATLGSGSGGDSVAWAPVEREAALLVDVLLSGEQGYFHGVNPRSASYTKDVLSALKQKLGLETVGWAEWVAKLAASEPRTTSREEIERNPGVKLLDFYQSMDAGPEGGDVNGIGWDTARSESVSETWRTMEPVRGEWLGMWVKQWGLA